MESAWTRAWARLPDGGPEPLYVLLPASKRDADERLGFWAERWTAELIRRIGAQEEGAVRRFEGADAGPGVFDWLGNGGFFETRRLAVWQEAGGRDLVARLEAFRQHPPTGSVLVVRLGSPAAWTARLGPGVVQVPLALPSEAEFGRLLDREARARGLKLAPAAREELLAAVRLDGFQLLAELEKLELWSLGHGGRAPGADLVALLAADPANPAELYRFLDAFLARRGPEAWAWLEELLDGGQPPLVILITAVRQLLLVRQLLKARTRGEPAARAAALSGLSGVRARRLLEASERWSRAGVEAALERAAMADAAVKRGGDARVWVESWVALAWGAPANENAPGRGRAG